MLAIASKKLSSEFARINVILPTITNCTLGKPIDVAATFQPSCLYALWATIPLKCCLHLSLRVTASLTGTSSACFLVLWCLLGIHSYRNGAGTYCTVPRNQLLNVADPSGKGPRNK